MRAHPLLLAAGLLLAGCSEPPASTEPTTTDSLTSTATTTPSTGPEPAEAPPANATREVAYAFEGRTWTTACLVAPPVFGQCQHLQEGSNLTEHFPDGPLVRIRGTLAWSDGNEEVGIGLVWEEGGEIRSDPRLYASGTSPLDFDWDVAALSDKGLAYHVASYVNAGPPEAHASASPGQDWRLDATLTVLG